MTGERPTSRHFGQPRVRTTVESRSRCGNWARRRQATPRSPNEPRRDSRHAKATAFAFPVVDRNAGDRSADSLPTRCLSDSSTNLGDSLFPLRRQRAPISLDLLRLKAQRSLRSVETLGRAPPAVLLGSKDFDDGRTPKQIGPASNATRGASFCGGTRPGSGRSAGDSQRGIRCAQEACTRRVECCTTDSQCTHRRRDVVAPGPSQ